MMTSTLRRRLLGTAVLVPALTLALTGCTFGFSPDGPPAPNGGESAPVAPPAEVDEPSDEPSTGDEITRARLEARADQQLTCRGGELEISDVGVAVEVTDDCARLVISGHGSIVLGAAVDELVVSGIGVVALVAEVDTVTVTGDGSVVLWESGAPTVDDESVGSVLLPAEAAR